MSHYQGLVNWEKVSSCNIKFAFAKATGGVNLVDEQFMNNWHGMREAGIIRGVYHFFYPLDNPQKQAIHFIKTMKYADGVLDNSQSYSDQEILKRDTSILQGAIPPVIDIEISENLTSKEIISGVLDWIEIVEECLGKKPIIYTNYSMAEKYLNSEKISEHQLWIAEYNKNSSIPAPWKNTQSPKHFIWQYTQSATIEGVNGSIDENRYLGSLDAFLNYINSSDL